MRKLKSIVVVIPHNVVAKTLHGSGALSELNREFKLHFLLSPEVTECVHAPCTRIDLSYRKSFWFYRLDMLFWYSELFHFLKAKGEVLRENYKYQKLSRTSRAVCRVLSAPGIFTITRWLDRILFARDKAVGAFLRDLSPELVIMPGSALDTYSFLVGRTAREQNISTLAIVTHWDYFSKKSLFRFVPDKVYLWGRDMLESAIRYGGQNLENFAVVGAPRFQKYFSGLPSRESAAHRLGLDPAKRWLLYAAPGVPFDDLSAVEAVNRFIEKHHPGAVGLIFRPHPGALERKSRITVQIEDMPNVTLDNPIDSVMEQDQHYIDLLALCSALISPWSTMVLEFGLVGRPALCISFPDGVNEWNWTNAERGEHAEALLSRKSVVLCRRESELHDKLNELIVMSEDVHWVEQIRRSMALAVYSDNSTYAERLLRQVKQDYFATGQAIT